jgi:hypothetical protein
MKRNYQKVPTRFGPDTRFEITPAPPAPFRALQESEFERLKSAMLRQLLAEAFKPQYTIQLRRAANDAAALAWVTPYPLLVFPALFEEKARAALAQAERQRDVRQRSRGLVCV